MTNGLAKGYTKIANQILESVMCSGFNKRELLILLYVFRKGYGFNREQSACELNVKHIAQFTQLDKSHIWKVLHLLESKQVIKIECNKIHFNRHAEQWSVAKTASKEARPKRPQYEAKTATERGQNSHEDSPIRLVVSDLPAPKETLNKKETPIPPKNGGSHPFNSSAATSQIIAFLNEATGKAFKPSIKGTQRLINALYVVKVIRTRSLKK